MKTQKHLGLNLDERLNYRENLKNKCAINNKRIGMLKKLSNYLPRHSLIIILHKAFVQPYLGYADITYDKPNNINILNEIESYWSIRGSSKGKLYQGLGFKYLSSRRWLGKFVFFIKFL